MSIATDQRINTGYRRTDSVVRVGDRPRARVRQSGSVQDRAAVRDRTAVRDRAAVRRSPAVAHGTPARRRYVGVAAPGATGQGYGDTCITTSRDEKAMSWLGMLAGVLATAVVVLGLIFVANLRAASLDSAPAPSIVTVLEGETLSEVAQRVAPNEPVQQVVDQMLALNNLGGASVIAGQELAVPESAGK